MIRAPDPSRFKRPYATTGGAGGASSKSLDLLATALFRRDPMSENVVAAFAEMPPGLGFSILQRGLENGVQAMADAPVDLRHLFEHLDQPPKWLSPQRMEAGAAALLRAGPAAGIVLGMKSLVLGYASPAGNKPLTFSGKLEEKTPRRLAETCRFVQAVSQPGGMRRLGQGFQITVKVRIMHAQVRALIGRSGSWRVSDWGEPINQHDMLATVILFSAALVEGLRQLGYTITPREADDISHLWRYVGHVMGVEEALLPNGHQQALDMADLIQQTQAPPDDDSRALVAALFSSRPQMATTPKEKQMAERRSAVMQALCRRLIGNTLADQLGLPPTAWGTRALLRAVGPVLAVASGVNRLPGARDLAAWAGNGYWEAAVREGGRGAMDFAPPEGIREPIGRPPANENSPLG